ncbi:MAG: energy transducer TonB [Ignavibacteria bacterium]|nr:energy transducer TonB [Ignavibacteria bacterium]
MKRPINEPGKEEIMNDAITLINNDKYGAPELKKMQQGYTLKGFIVAVTIHVALIAAYMLVGYINQSKAKEIPFNPKTPIILTDVDFTPPPIDETEIPPVKEEVIQKVKDLSSLQPEPVRKTDADDVVLKTQDELNNINTNTSRTGDTIIIASNNNVKIDDIKIDDMIKDVIKEAPKDVYGISEVDVAPECINLSQVNSEMNYPELAIETGMQGKVTVKVLVGPDGNVIKLGSLSGPEVFHSEVKDKAGQLQFTPGLQSNKPVKVWVSVPFNFKLK